MRHLSNREARTINALMEVIIPQDGPFSLGCKDIDTISFFEDFLSHVPFKVKWFLFFNLWIFEYFSWISLLFCHYSDFEKQGAASPKSFLRNLIFLTKTPGFVSKMRFDYREKIIVKMQENRFYVIRGIHLLTSIVLLMSFYRDNRVMDKIGYYGYKEGENKLNK